jgi:hypothetical protein
MNSASVELDIDALHTITHYAHWIPALRGISEEYVARNYPGWQWNEIVPFLLREGVLTKQSDKSQLIQLRNGISISQRIERVVITRTKKGLKVTIKRSHSTPKVRS